MIGLENVSDSPRVGRHRWDLFNRVYFTVPRGRYALLAREPNMRRHAIDILSGTRPPRRGRVLLEGVPSWAIGRSGFIRGKVNGLHVIDLIARLYDLDAPVCRQIVVDLLSEPELLQESIEHWSGPMRQEFGHCVALLPAFDIHFIDGTLPAGKSRFAKLWRPLFAERTQNSMLILSSVRVAEIKRYCDRAVIIDRGRMEILDDLEAALAHYPPRPTNEEEPGLGAFDDTGIRIPPID